MEMKVYVGGRRVGKTLEVLENLAGNKGSVLIVPNHQTARSILDNHSWTKGRVFTWGQVTSQRALQGRDVSGVFIDEAQWILQSQLGPYVILGMSICGSAVRLANPQTDGSWDDRPVNLAEELEVENERLKVLNGKFRETIHGLMSGEIEGSETAFKLKDALAENERIKARLEKAEKYAMVYSLPPSLFVDELLDILRGEG